MTAPAPAPAPRPARTDAPCTRRRAALLTLGAPWLPLHAQVPAAAAQQQVPLLSSAALGRSVARGWRHQTLPKVALANQFEIVDLDGRRVLQVRSQGSASSWLAPLDIDAAARPLLRWRWRVSKSLLGSDIGSKPGDDYAARLYVFFDLPLQQLSLADRLRLQAARLLAGVEVPSAAICYVWGHAQAAGASGWNAYTDRLRMVVVDSGDSHAGQWRSVSRNLPQDWDNAFGGAMPRVNGVAVGSDTDNTGDSVLTWFDDLSLDPAGSG